MRPAFFGLWAVLALAGGAPAMAADAGLPSEDEVRALLAVREDAVARDLLGVILSRAGRLAEAEKEFRRAVELEPGLADARQHLARVLLLRGASAEAAEQLRAAARLGPLERDLAFQLATLEAAAGNPEAAARQWASLAERFDSVQALLQLGRIEAGRGRMTAAAEHLSRAAVLAPNSEEVLATYARVSIFARDPVPAILALEPLMRMAPTVAEYPYLMGVARIQAGDAPGALAALEQARALEPKRAATLVALGLALNQQKRFDEAREILAESLRLQPDDVEGLAGLAEAEVGLDELDSAESHVRRALSMNPEHPLGNLVLGVLEMRRDRFSNAAEALQRVVAVDPESPKAHYQLSLAYSRLGDRERHREHLALYREALEKNRRYLAQLKGQDGGM